MTSRVGIVLTARPGDLGEWLADGAAFDAAGADALWVEMAPESGLDPVALMAAMAAVTKRAMLVTAMPETVAAQALSTVRRLARGRFVEPGDAGQWVRMPVPTSRAEWATTLAELEAEGEGKGDGILVDADARLLDLLRNPGEPGERFDLELATG